MLPLVEPGLLGGNNMPDNGWKGKKHSAATKAKISASLKARSAGKAAGPKLLPIRMTAGGHVHNAASTRAVTGMKIQRRATRPGVGGGSVKPATFKPGQHAFIGVRRASTGKPIVARVEHVGPLQSRVTFPSRTPGLRESRTIATSALSRRRPR